MQCFAVADDPGMGYAMAIDRSGEVAGVGLRVAAFAIDYGLLMVLTAIGVPLNSFGLGLPYLLFRVAMHAWRGQTPGKMLIGIKLAREDSIELPSLRSVAIREGMYFLVFLPVLVTTLVTMAIDPHGRALAYFLAPTLLLLNLFPLAFIVAIAMMLSTPLHQTWADRVAQTRVIRTR